jgi:putative MATE family efflux protein
MRPATLAPAAPAAVAPATRRLLEAPILPTLLRLAAPNVAVMLLQSSTSIADAYFVASLGADALAGVALVFPFLMLMQMMSAGGMGGGVASAVARALGGGRRGDADALVPHALAIGAGLALVFTAGMLGGGPAIYRAMGARDGALAAALAYSNVIFVGALSPWLYNTLMNLIRGTGNMTLPATLTVMIIAIQLPLSPSLIYGLGPLPRLGVAGAGVAMITAYGAAALVAAGYVFSGRALITPAWRRPRWRLFREILRVGVPGAVTTVIANMTVLLVTGLVGRFGTPALAGYGIGARLEYLQIPIVFGLGAALVAMVGTNVGAGRRARAERIAWTGAALAAAATGTMGAAAALSPTAWLGWFTREPAVLAAGAAYLRIVGPTYAFLGLGLALYFASQGAGRLAWPLTAGVLRLVIAGTGGWLAVDRLGAGLDGIFVALAVALVVFGSTIALAVRFGAWR